MNNDSLPARKHPVHPKPIERMGKPTVLFVTVRMADKKHNLITEQSREALVQAWADSEHWKVGLYMIMPDHVHFFCVPGVMDPLNVQRWCKFWKGQYKKIMGLSDSVWQRDCWDTQMRNSEHYVEKASYIRMNPVRKELVENPEDWEYQGEITEIRW